MDNKWKMDNTRKIGVNLVNPDRDVEEFYTREGCLQVLERYQVYSGLIQYLEYSHVVNLSPEDAEVVGNRSREYGFLPWSIHSEHLNEGNRVEEYLKIQKHEAEVCAALGCRVMVCHLPNLLPYLEFERDLEIIGNVADLTRSCGVRLAVETCGYSDGEHAFLSDAELVIRIVDALNRDDVGINLDSGHCLLGQTEKNPERLARILSGETPQGIPALVERIGKRLFTTHLQDNFGLNDDHQAPGIGYLDWPALIHSIRNTGYSGPLMMELTGNHAKIRRSVCQMRNFPLEKEIIFAASYLNFLDSQIGGLP